MLIGLWWSIWQGSAQLAEWEIRPEDLQIATTPDGKDIVLGAGAFGAVRRQAAAMHFCTLSLHSSRNAQCAAAAK